MDILKPDLMWIGRRCYRVNKRIDCDENLVVPQTNQYIEEDLYDDVDDEDDYDIQEIDRNRFKTTFHVPQQFFAVIIGSKGATKKRIEGETKTQIKIPKPGIVGDIEIVGATREGVSSSRRRIDIIVLSSRTKQQNTHFLCVPVLDPQIKENYRTFVNEILSGPSIFGLEESLFQSPDKLHITIFTLCLMDNVDRTLAAQLLQDCYAHIVRPILDEHGTIEINMRGVEYMNDDPSEVDVLYGKVVSKPLQKVADSIMDYFVSQGLIQSQHNNVKLHVTLINTLFRKTREDEENLPRVRKTFDAQNILKKYATYNFGRQKISEIHLSLRYSTASDKFFEATGVLKI